MDIYTLGEDPKCILITAISKAGTASQQYMSPRSRRRSSVRNETCADSHLHGRHDIFLVGQMRPRPSKRLLSCCSRSCSAFSLVFIVFVVAYYLGSRGHGLKSMNPGASHTSAFSCSSTEHNIASAARCRLLLHHYTVQHSKRPPTHCGVSIQLEQY